MNARSFDLQQRAEARIGEVLRDKWRLERLLGMGGMAAVYLARHRNGKEVAIKLLHPEAALVPDIKARFLREGYLANKVSHPGAVSILDDDAGDDGSVFLVMELLNGETLDARWAREGVLSWEFVLPMAYKVLDVLCAAHAKNIVHRDLKPANIFLDTSGSIKILDFGIARLESLSAGSHATLRDSTLGTPGFMPPEQARGHWDRVDAQSDLWAVGANMFALITGRHVHEAPTVNEQLLAAMTLPAPPLRELAAQIPPEVAKIVDRALAFEKGTRYPDAETMRSELRSVYESLTDKSIEQSLPVPTLPRRSLRIADAPTLAATLNEASTSRSLRQSRIPRNMRSATGYTVAAVLLAAVAASVGLATSRTNHERSSATARPTVTAPLATPAPSPTLVQVAPPEPAPQVETQSPKPAEPAESKASEPPVKQARRDPVARRLKPSPKPVRASTVASSASATISPEPAPTVSDDDFFNRRK